MLARSWSGQQSESPGYENWLEMKPKLNQKFTSEMGDAPAASANDGDTSSADFFDSGISCDCFNLFWNICFAVDNL